MSCMQESKSTRYKRALAEDELNTRKAENRLRKERGLPLRKIK